MAVSHLVWVLGMNSGLLQEQLVFLTTEPSLQPSRNIFNQKNVSEEGGKGESEQRLNFFPMATPEHINCFPLAVEFFKDVCPEG